VNNWIFLPSLVVPQCTQVWSALAVRFDGGAVELDGSMVMLDGSANVGVAARHRARIERESMLIELWK
jgi:hypothetical protein